MATGTRDIGVGAPKSERGVPVMIESGRGMKCLHVVATRTGSLELPAMRVVMTVDAFPVLPGEEKWRLIPTGGG
jgi:hypothetical protein